MRGRDLFFGLLLAIFVLGACDGKSVMLYRDGLDGDLDMESPFIEDSADNDAEHEADPTPMEQDGDLDSADAEFDQEQADAPDADDDGETDGDADREMDGAHDGDRDADTAAEHEGDNLAETDETDDGDGIPIDDGLEDCILRQMAVMYENGNSGWWPNDPDTCYRRELDALGRVAKYYPDYTCSGVYTACFRYVYNADNRVLSRHYDPTCDDALGIDERECSRYTYDAAGRLLTSHDIIGCERGTAKDCYDKTYDEHERVQTFIYTDCTDKKFSCASYGYDEAGNRISARSDNHLCDGTDLSCCFFTYDVRGLRVNEGCDKGCDSVMDSLCQSGTLDAKGRIVRQLVDENCDQVIEDCRNYGYDDTANSFSQSFGCDEKRDGCYWEYYSSDGRLQKTIEDANCDQKTRLVTEDRVYDGAGRITACHIYSSTSLTTIDFSYEHGRCRPGAVKAILGDQEFKTASVCTWSGGY